MARACLDKGVFTWHVPLLTPTALRTCVFHCSDMFSVLEGIIAIGFVPCTAAGKQVHVLETCTRLHVVYGTIVYRACIVLQHGRAFCLLFVHEELVFCILKTFLFY